jgi:hypothetical protein
VPCMQQLHTYRIMLHMPSRVCNSRGPRTLIGCLYCTFLATQLETLMPTGSGRPSVALSNSLLALLLLLLLGIQLPLKLTSGGTACAAAGLIT